MNSPPDRATAPDTPSRASSGERAPSANSTNPAGPDPTNRIHSHEVMRGQNTVAIEHNGSIYRLQTTRQGKLILTK